MCPIDWYNCRMEFLAGAGLNGYEIPVGGAVLNRQVKARLPMRQHPINGPLPSLTM
jgi:hypothetical protein